MIGAELPCVIVNMVRGGPGLGNIACAQSDYWLSTRGGGHGDGQCLTYAPWTVQEIYDLTMESFALAQKYRNPLVVLGDAILAQMMEPVQPREWVDPNFPRQEWAVGGSLKGRERQIVSSIYISDTDLEGLNCRVQDRYREAARQDTRWEELGDEEPELLVCAYGIAARVCHTAIELAAQAGVKARLLRPISLFPFPTAPIRQWSERVKKVLVVELSMGQFIDDVRLSVEGRCPVELAWHSGGKLFGPEEVAARLIEMRA
jgi:2-oxoglutarate ferredoxin oxidoreductase subunit alpha